MTIERLRIFLAIVATGTVSAAARQVFLTQPAVSRNLRLLEESLHTPLFSREGRGLVLTAAGRALVPRARRLLADSEALSREVQRASEVGFFDIRIGAVDSVATFVMPYVLADLQSRFEGLGIKLWTDRTASLLEKVSDDALDVAVVAYSSPPPGARVERVGTYRMRYWGRRDRFAALETLQSEAEVQQYPLIEIQALAGQPTMITSGASTFAVASSVASVKAFILAGFGVGALLDFMVSDAERELLSCGDGLPHDADCGLYAVFGKGAAKQAIAEHLVVQLRRHLSQGVPTPGLTATPIPESRTPG